MNCDEMAGDTRSSVPVVGSLVVNALSSGVNLLMDRGLHSVSCGIFDRQIDGL